MAAILRANKPLAKLEHSGGLRGVTPVIGCLTSLGVKEHVTVGAYQELADRGPDLRDDKVTAVLGPHDPIAELHIVAVGTSMAPGVWCLAMLAITESLGVRPD